MDGRPARSPRSLSIPVPHVEGGDETGQTPRFPTLVGLFWISISIPPLSHTGGFRYTGDTVTANVSGNS